ncbi:hypothetical protein BDZ91DRAFT_709688 [Kalaharituber pfeilii]|nr:hypothetical protein BDZ91DRAFT_709688 [Kalaharituber pfeilii]
MNFVNLSESNLHYPGKRHLWEEYLKLLLNRLFEWLFEQLLEGARERLLEWGAERLLEWLPMKKLYERLLEKKGWGC